MKRVVYLVMVIAMLASLGAAALAGCAPKPTPAPATQAPPPTQAPTQAPTQPPKPTNTPVPAQPTPAPAKTVEIEFWYGLGGKLGEVVQDFIKRFNESQTEVHVTGVVMPDYQTTLEKLQAAIAAKKPPAIALISGERIHDLMNAQVLNPLDDLIAAEPDFNPQDIVPAFYQFATWEDGKHYALPLYGTTQVLYYRKDFFQELGISPDMLNTWEDLAEAARKCTKVEGGEVVRWGWEPMWGYPNLRDAVLSRGGKQFSDDGKKVLINDEIWVDTWEQFRKWIHEEKIMRIHYGGEGWAYWYDTIDDVMQGRACGYTGSSGDQGDLDFSIIAAHIQPGWKNPPHPPAPVAQAHFVVFPLYVDEAQTKAALKFYKYFTSTDMTAEWSARTGYLPVRLSAQQSPKLIEASKTTMPAIMVPAEQTKYASPLPVDPTGGKITDALTKAADKVEIEGIPAKEALDEAAAEAQAALDEYWASKK